MFRTFLSWRYLTSRRTNYIGVVGIAVAVGAMIMIMSIMSGFIDETKSVIRGNLADVVVEPWIGLTRPDGKVVPVEPHPALRVIRADERVRAAAPRLVWWGMIGQGIEANADSGNILTNQGADSLAAVQLIGVDVATRERAALAGLAAALRFHGVRPPALRLQDEFDATDLLSYLRRGPRDLRTGRPVANPLLPFAPPPGYEPEGRRKASVVVGEQLFTQLRLERGDVLHVMTVVPDRDDPEGRPAMNNREFVVAGSFRSGENDIDLTRIYLDRRELADFLGGEATYGEILIAVDDYDTHGHALQDDLVERLDAAGLVYGEGDGDPRPKFQVETWEDVRRPLLGAIENERVLMAIMLSLTLVIAGFTIYAILTMMVIEKRRDIGILSALGATPRGVLATFLMIGFWDALIGTAVGALAGVQAALHIDAVERGLSAAIGKQIFNRNVYYFDEIPSRVEVVPVLLIVAGAFLAALLSAALPAWKAARQHPIDALRYE